MIPPRIEAGINKYFNDSSSIKSFLEQHHYEITNDEKDRISSSDIYQSYDEFCKNKNIKTRTQRDFKSFMTTEIGFGFIKNYRTFYTRIKK